MLQLGLAVIDRFTYATLDYLQRMKVGDWIRDASLRDLFSFYDPRMLFSTPDYRADILGRAIDNVPLTDFFGSVLDVQLHYAEEAYPLEGDDVDEDANSMSAAAAGVDAKQGEAAATQQQQPIKSERKPRRQQQQPQQFGFSADFFVVGAVFVVGLAVVTTKKL